MSARLPFGRAARLPGPGLVVAAPAALSFATANFVYLASWNITDDSYYYLKPAWLFKQHGFFTYDGEMPLGRVDSPLKTAMAKNAQHASTARWPILSRRFSSWTYVSGALPGCRRLGSTIPHDACMVSGLASR